MATTNGKPQLIIIAGPNGAGKSTLAPILLRDWLGVKEYVNADTLAQGLSAFQPESVALEAGRLMLRRLRELAAQKANFAFETTLATRTYAAWLRELRANGYRIHLFYLWLQSPALAIQRVQERVRQGGHSIPPEVVTRRYRKGIHNFFELYQPLMDTWAVYNNTKSDELQLIAQGRINEPPGILLPDWWERFKEFE
jgi:predicted ABC-type ATPase